MAIMGFSEEMARRRVGLVPFLSFSQTVQTLVIVALVTHRQAGDEYLFVLGAQ